MQFERRDSAAELRRLRQSEWQLLLDNEGLVEQNKALRERVAALEENLHTAQTKLLLQRRAWQEVSKAGGLAAHLLGTHGEDTDVSAPAGVAQRRLISTPKASSTGVTALALGGLSGIGDGARPVTARPASSRLNTDRLRPQTARAQLDPNGAGRPLTARGKGKRSAGVRKGECGVHLQKMPDGQTRGI